MRTSLAMIFGIGGVLAAVPSTALAADAPLIRWSRLYGNVLEAGLPSVEMAKFPLEWLGEEIPPISDHQRGSLVVIACTLKTPNAETLAREVAREIRSELGLRTFLHRIREPGHEGVSVIVAGGRTWEQTDAIQTRIRAMTPRCLAGTSAAGRLRRAQSWTYPFDQGRFCFSVGAAP